MPEFDPYTAGLEDLVIFLNGRHRTPKQGQLAALRNQPLVRLPERIRDAL